MFGTAWVSNADTGTVTPVDLATGMAGEPIDVDQVPSWLVAAPDGRTVYLSGSGGLTPVDTAQRDAGPIMPIFNCYRVALTPDGERAYATSIANRWVVPFDLTSRQVGHPITFTEAPMDIAITPDGSTAWVVVPLPPHLTPIDLATATRGTPIPIPLPVQLRAIVLSPNGRTAYVASSNTPELFPVDLTTRIVGTPITLRGLPSDVEISPDGLTALVTYGSLNAASIVDLPLGQSGPLITVGEDPQGVTIDRASRVGYVANNTAAGTITPIDLTTGQAGQAIPAGPFAGDVVLVEPAAPPPAPPAAPTPASPTFTG